LVIQGDSVATFEVSDFIPVPMERQKSGGRGIDVDAIKRMMEDDENLADLLNSNGVYVFSVKAGRGRKPWYVGKSEKSTFLKEALNPRNLVLLNSLVNNRRGTLELTLITQAKARGKPNLSQISEIEYLLIGHAAERNHGLLNNHYSNQGDKFTLKNIYNSGAGKRSKREQAFKDLMGL
jgi:hypothetical protein